MKNDLDGLLRLYMQLHNKPMPENTVELLQIWDTIFQDKNHHVIVAEENVITDEEFRKRGLATQCLDYAKEIAIKENCYKMMLLTGSKKKSTLDFYRKAGYNSDDKTAFIPPFQLQLCAIKPTHNTTHLQAHTGSL